MALDTIAKRFAAMHPACPWRMTLPPPDGTISQADRQQFVYQSAAVLFTTTGGGGGGSIFGGQVVR